MVWRRVGAVLAGLALLMVPIVGAPIASATTNLLTNGDFETGTTTGWSGVNASLSVSSVTPHGGSFAGKLVYSGSGTTFVIKASPKPVSSTGGGTVYTADGFFRSDTPGHSICLKLTEAGTQSGSGVKCATSTMSWAALPEVAYTALASGDTLSFSVVAKTPVSGNSFEVDDLSLTTGTVGCGATVCPPTNLHTTNVTSTEVDLAWDPSPTTGVVSYSVYRGLSCSGLSQLNTVLAPTTNYADMGLSPSTNYAYAVDAVDGSMNHSIQTTCLPVMTLSSGGTAKIIAAAGDIACSPNDPNFNGGAGIGTGVLGNCRQAAVASLIQQGTYDKVLPLGDEQYDCGDLTSFNASYDKSWGAFNSKSEPVPGNHEYKSTSSTGDTGCSSSGTGYFQYFAQHGVTDAAGVNGHGYYSYDLGSWHVIAINSECTSAATGGCGAGSTQEKWVLADLAAHPNQCTMAYWHEAAWSTVSGGVTALRTIWADLANAGVDLVLVGHFHHYERFADLNASGQPVATGTGTREIIVGTGGKSEGSFGSSTPLPGSEKRLLGFGILAVTLSSGSYSWQYLQIDGTTADSGGPESCH